MKFSLTIINHDPQIVIRVIGEAGKEERIQVVGRLDHRLESLIRLDAEKIIDMEHVLERLLGVRVHISQAG